MAAYHEPGDPSVLAVLDDHAVLAEARRIYGDGGDDACLRARRFLDRTLQERTLHWRAQLSCGQVAVYLEMKGRREQARFFGELDCVTPRLAEVAHQWRHRYLTRGETLAQKQDRLILAAAREVIWDEPYVGIDGMAYTVGTSRFWNRGQPVVVAESRAAVEIITSFQSAGAAHNWIRDDRCAADLRRLTSPPGVFTPRVTAEEQILSALLERPGELTEVAEWLPAHAFTADIRYEIFAAINLARRDRHDSITRAFGGPPIDAITKETLRRLAWSPDWDNPCLGGPGTPLASVYLHRLASTPVTAAAAVQAACLLAADDASAQIAAGLPAITHPPGPAHRGGVVAHRPAHPVVTGLIPPAPGQRPRSAGPAPRP